MMTRSELSNLSKKIAAHIVGSGVSLRTESNDALVYLAAQETTPDSRWSDINASFSTDPKARWDSDGEICVRSDGAYEKTTDEEGNITSVTNISVTVRWSGTSDAAADEKLFERLELLNKITTLALDLKREYAGPVTFLVRTAAEEKERQGKEAAEDMRRKVQRMAEYPSKGLRAGGNSRSVGRELFTSCADGVYEVSYDEGRRKCRVVLRPGSASIVRLA